MKWTKKHLLGIEGLSAKEITLILDTAKEFREVLERPIRKVPALRGKTVINLFFEPSTRTSASFSAAAKNLSADTVNFSKATSSVQKGETLLDTAMNLEAMKADIVVIRHSVPGAPHYLAERISSSVVNAGDGAHEHPTQALLDMMTIREQRGSFKNLNILIVGDILHSRVARSDIIGFKTMGANVRVCGPPTLMPLWIDKMGVDVFYDLDEALNGIDVVYVLRIQLERQKSGMFPSIREYRNLYGITNDRFKKMKKDILIMHPGPMNRGVEIDSEVADSPKSVILEQVTNGVAVRMAVLYLLSGGSTNE